MPPKCIAGMTRDVMAKCFPEEIEIRPEMNGRQDKPDIEWLITSILEHGQLQPCGIWDDGGQAVLSFGFSRWRAISEINKRKLAPNKLQIKCVYVNCNEKGAFIRNISENRMRNETTPIDDAHNIRHLADAWQMPEAEIARIYFPTAATEDELKRAVKWIHARLELIKLTPESEKAMKDGRLTETAAAAIAKLSAAQQRAALSSKEGKITAKDIKGLKSSKPRAAKVDGELKRRITAVTESADWSTYDENLCPKIFVTAEALAALDNYFKELPA